MAIRIGGDWWEPRVVIGDEKVADREGFEPPIPLRVCRISSAVHSTTLPPVRGRLRSKQAGYYTRRRAKTSLSAVIILARTHAVP